MGCQESDMTEATLRMYGGFNSHGLFDNLPSWRVELTFPPCMWSELERSCLNEWSRNRKNSNFIVETHGTPGAGMG